MEPARAKLMAVLTSGVLAGGLLGSGHPPDAGEPELRDSGHEGAVDAGDEPGGGGRDDAGSVPPLEYVMQPQGSLLYVEIFSEQTPLASSLVNGHVIRASSWEGTIEYDPEDPAGCRAEMSVPVSALVVDEPWLRERLGYAEVLDAGERADLRRALLSEGGLDADHHPAIHVTGSDCRLDEDEQALEVRLELSVRGITTPLWVFVDLAGGTSLLRAAGSLEVELSELGLSSGLPNSTESLEALRFYGRVEAQR